MAHECVVLAESPGALVELCGISTLERLLHFLATQSSPAVLVDSAVPSKFQPLMDSAPNALGAKVCGAALLQRDWVSTQNGPLEKAINNGLEQNSIPAVDVIRRPCYS